MSNDTVVECYSGHTYAQEPRTFRVANERRRVTAVRKRWREATGPCFDVLADDARVYVLSYNETTDRWTISAKANGREFPSSAGLGQITSRKEEGQ
jgi:hypothetical protein